MTNKITLDGTEFNLDDLSENGKELVSILREMDVDIQEKMNLNAIFTKAKKAYIAELKSEILSQKAGLDFTD